MIDLYFEPRYGKLYEKVENGKCEIFNYKCDYGSISNMFIKREIPVKIDKVSYFDIITPYGYGGPLIIECEKGEENKLVSGFKSEFQKYCNDYNIVSEFIRFHPITKNSNDFLDCYNIEHIRNTVGTNLEDYEEPFKEEFSKSCRKNIKKALKAGVSYKITENPTDSKCFEEIYYSTMDRNRANDYYYFDREYFKNSLDLLGENIILVEAIYQDTTIAMGFYFKYNKTIHIHLSGTLSEYLYLSPAYILRYAITLWGKQKGYNLIHHGGGKSNSPDDSLYLFKKQFGKNTEFEYCIGKKIWNEVVYSNLCKKVNGIQSTDFFPAYRN